MLGFLRGDDLKGSAIAPVEGSHSGIGKDGVFKLSVANAITPHNPPATIFDSYRAMPVMDRVREFTPEEADALGQLAKGKKANAKATKKVVKHHASILQSTRRINKYGQQMIRAEAETEVSIQGYKATTGRLLHGQRSKYAALGQGLKDSEINADRAIEKLMAGL